VIGSSVAASVAVATSLALITLRSRPLLLCIWSGVPRCTAQYAFSARRHLARQRPLTKNTASTPFHRPIEFFANNFFDCRHRGSLAASTQVNNAPRVRHPPSIFSTYAPRLERVLLTRGDGVLHIKISGSLSNHFFWYSLCQWRFQTRILDSGWIQGVCADMGYPPAHLAGTWR
jgi:hypothetical protein